MREEERDLLLRLPLRSMREKKEVPESLGFSATYSNLKHDPQQASCLPYSSVTAVPRVVPSAHKKMQKANC